MKKTILAIVFGCLGVILYAQNPQSANFTIKITSEWSGGDWLTFMERSTYSDGEDPDSDLPKIPNTGEGSINLYGIVGANHYSTVAKQHLEGSPIGLITNEYDSHYDVEFTTSYYAEGRDTLYFEDLEKGTLTKIVKGTKFSIDFETAKRDTIEKRFRIYKPFSGDEGELEVCYEDDFLKVKNNPYTTNIVVKNAEGEEVINKMPTSTPQEISLETLPAGRYTVEFNGGEKKYIIAVKPEMKTEETPVP